MSVISITVTDELKERLGALSGKTGLTQEECLLEALEEYVENREAFQHVLETLDEEESVQLSVVNA